MNKEDRLLLSAYIDDELSSQERDELEARLEKDRFLQDELDSLRQTVALVRDMPLLKAPRNYTLDPAIYGPSSPPEDSQPRSPLMLTGFTRMIMAAAAMLIILVGATWLFSSMMDTTESDTEDKASVAQQENHAEASELALVPTSTPAAPEEAEQTGNVEKMATGEPLEDTEDMADFMAGDESAIPESEAEVAMDVAPAMPATSMQEREATEGIATEGIMEEMVPGEPFAGRPGARPDDGRGGGGGETFAETGEYEEESAANEAQSQMIMVSHMARTLLQHIRHLVILQILP